MSAMAVAPFVIQQMIQGQIHRGGYMARKPDLRYKITGDIEPASFWLVTTPGAAMLEMPYVCLEAGTLLGRQSFLTERAGKDSYLLLYTKDGEGFVTQGARTVTVGRGQALLMDCRTPQSYGTSPSSDRWHHLWAHVEGRGVEATARRLGLPKLVPLSVSSSRMEPHFDIIFERLEREGIENEELVGLAVHGLMTSLLIASVRGEKPETHPIVLAQNFIAAHYAEPIAVEDIARAATVSGSYLTRVFRKELGTSPHDYLVRYRITRAKQLLVETDLSVGEIARQVGFKTESNFSYRFSKLCGTSPRGYRAARGRL